MNGGHLIPPTFLKRTEEEARRSRQRVIKPETSEKMRYLMRLNAEKGTATQADVPGYYVGGKTGTAEKVVDGRYSKTKVLTDFMAVLPADKPRYLLLIMLDEPQALPETHGFTTVGLECGADRRRRDRPDRAAPWHRAALRPAAGRPADPGHGEGKQVRRMAACDERTATAMKLRDLLPADADARRRATRDLDVRRASRADSRTVKPRRPVRRACPAARPTACASSRRRSPPAPSPSLRERMPDTPAADGVAFVRVADARRALALAAAKFFPRQPRPSPPSPAPAAKPRSPPSRARSGRRSAISAASIGTIGLVSPSGETYGSLTTPDPVDLHRTLDALAGEGVTHLAIEASSHGLDQHRLDGVRIAAGGLHQYHARSSRLSSELRCLSRRQAAAVRGDWCRAAAPP